MTAVAPPGETVDLPRFRVLSTLVHAVDRDASAAFLARCLEDRRPHQIVTVNVDFLRLAQSSAAFSAVINGADLAVPDGKPLVLMARYLGLSACERVTGIDLIETAARLSMEHGHSIFLLGGAEGVAEQAKQALEAGFPGAQICGAYSPPPAAYPFPPDLDAEITRRVKAARPDVLFVGFGCPKQDLWIHDHLEALDVPVSVGIGGSFSFLAGLLPRAPLALQRLGLEWLFRLYQEPGRLGRRYLREDLPFVLRLVRLEIGRRLRAGGDPILEVETR